MENTILKLYEMCQNENFNIEEAKGLVSEVNLNEPFREPRHNSETFFLYTAVFYQNIRMVELLLQSGANPNLIVNYEAPFGTCNIIFMWKKDTKKILKLHWQQIT